MNPFLAVGLGVLIFLANMLYSAYSIKILKEHSQKLSTYKSLKEENLRLRAEIERMLNIKELERYALRRGFKPFNWEEFALILFKEPSKKGRTKRRRR
ncbi:hypothetical protein [Hydrogenivirga sp. 128-5-R1-1]|uniref:hypothetical protein n=1 Tax=Hydrogenivirga sp. 128-5-R1-1 TaxID=392423 RepID=UPI00015EF72C|nr:hypothetical protein [Hydrogenivirga sp. 128-5-R1-1]EDP75767.1 hypothetical protein HG1285_17425 [Hydrogenivirga sp. 128-5-R1-1]